MDKSFYKEIINKLELLIKKEYLALSLLGLLTTLIIVVSVFTLFSIVELAVNFKSTFRTILFFLFILAAIGSVSYLILIPLLKYFNAFRKRDYFYSAKLVGNSFPDIKDDLLNAMQLVSSEKDNSILLNNIAGCCV